MNPISSAALIVEVRANENMGKDRAPHVPYSPAELAEDALECATAGAAVYHWHARDEDGRAVDDETLFVDTARAIRGRSDIVLKPTLGFNRESSDARIRHVVAMKKAGEHLVDYVPIDNFTTNSDIWDESTKRFLTLDSVYTNTRGHVIGVIEELGALDIPHTLVCTDIASIRTGLRYREMGVISGRIRWEFGFNGGSADALGGPGLPLLGAMIRLIGPEDCWSVLFHGGDILPVAGTVILMGGHVAVGLGDYPHARFGNVRNADLVEKLCMLAEIAGRPVASAAEARKILGLPA